MPIPSTLYPLSSAYILLPVSFSHLVIPNKTVKFLNSLLLVCSLNITFVLPCTVGQKVLEYYLAS